MIFNRIHDIVQNSKHFTLTTYIQMPQTFLPPIYNMTERVRYTRLGVTLILRSRAMPQSLTLLPGLTRQLLQVEMGQLLIRLRSRRQGCTVRLPPVFASKLVIP